MRAWICIVIGMLDAACADTLEAKPNSADQAQDETGFTHSGKFASRELDDDVTDTKVEAFDSESWQRFDLDTAQSATDEHTWDLEFSRYLIHTNGGVSGAAGVQLAVLDRAFDAVDSAPSDGYSEDQKDSEGEEGDTNTEPDNLFNSPEHSWFDYDLKSHTVSPHPNTTYVLRSSEGAYFKLAIVAYYDKAGTPGQMRFHWKALNAP